MPGTHLDHVLRLSPSLLKASQRCRGAGALSNRYGAAGTSCKAPHAAHPMVVTVMAGNVPEPLDRRTHFSGDLQALRDRLHPLPADRIDQAARPASAAEYRRQSLAEEFARRIVSAGPRHTIYGCCRRSPVALGASTNRPPDDVAFDSRNDLAATRPRARDCAGLAERNTPSSMVTAETGGCLEAMTQICASTSGSIFVCCTPLRGQKRATRPFRIHGGKNETSIMLAIARREHRDQIPQKIQSRR